MKKTFAANVIFYVGMNVDQANKQDGTQKWTEATRGPGRCQKYTVKMKHSSANYIQSHNSTYI